jgi:hypothetical protein
MSDLEKNLMAKADFGIEGFEFGVCLMASKITHYQNSKGIPFLLIRILLFVNLNRGFPKIHQIAFGSFNVFPTANIFVNFGQFLVEFLFHCCNTIFHQKCACSPLKAK